jgi:tetratricopeptide (TPR) repeat protein
MVVSDPGLEERDRVDGGRSRTWRTLLARGSAVALAVVLTVAVCLALQARGESAGARSSLTIAREALDELLSSVDREPGRAAAESPQAQEVRHRLLATAERFYTALVSWAPGGEASRRDRASAQFRLGHIGRMRDEADEAARAYQEAIAGFRELTRAHPHKAEYRVALGDAFYFLGEALRPLGARAADAERAYSSAFDLQQRLVQESPQSAPYREAFAQTSHSRAILRAGMPGAAMLADADFREAIRALEPLAGASDRVVQQLGRMYYDLGGLLKKDPERVAEAQGLWEKAIGIDERIVIRNPANREAKLELATYCRDLAALLGERGDVDEADRRSRMALGLIDSLTRVPSSLALERADLHALRGRILQDDDPAEAVIEYEQALDLHEELLVDRDLLQSKDFHEQFANLLLNLASFPQNARNHVRSARQMLSRGLGLYAGAVSAMVASGEAAAAQHALEQLTRILPAVPEADRAELSGHIQHLQRRLADANAR